MINYRLAFGMIVNCRVGSLEIHLANVALLQDVNCRVGSLETFH